MRYSLRTLLILLTLSVSPVTVTSGIEPEPTLIKELQRQLTESLGDSFEFVRGVRVPTDQIPVYQVSLGGRRWSGMWFAELRAKRAGDFGLSYSAELPATVNKEGWTIEGSTYRFIAPVKIHTKDTRRFLQLWSAGTLEDGYRLVLSVKVDFWGRRVGLSESLLKGNVSFAGFPFLADFDEDGGG